MKAMKRSAPDNDTPATTRPIRLMLHAVDGVIPYMTPLLLKNHFPPGRVSEHFVLGIAVRDTCINAVYPNQESISVNKKKKKQKLDTTKPCGHTFSSSPMDEFLSGYDTVVVPSFDLWQDASFKSTTATCTDKQVLMWTPHGRHGLSPDLYQKAVSGFEGETSIAVVSLYDMALDKDTSKRKQVAVQRNRTWLEHFLKQTKAKVWAPILLHKDDDKTKAVEQCVRAHPSITGIALVGWPHITERSDRNHRLEKAVKAYCDQQHEVAVLTTCSTLQILDAVRLGVNVIGTELPTLWARSKRAFCCNLEGWASEQVDPDNTLDENGCMDMHDTARVRDSRPLVLKCQCLACHNNKHSRAYIHHLVQAKELLAEILLFGHNLHQLLLLCREASNALQQGKADEFCDFVENQMSGREKK